MSARELYDAVVVGAGPAGATLSRSLARSGWSVLAIDKNSPGERRVCGGFLGPEAKALFDDLGLSASFSTLQKNPVQRVLISAPSGAVFETAFDCEPGWAIDRGVFDGWLASEARQSGVRIAEKTLLSKCHKHQGLWQLLLQDTDGVYAVAARRLFFAHGRRLPRSKKSASAFFACRCELDRASVPDDRVELHFVPGGHVGLNPLPHRKTTLCLYVEKKHLHQGAGNLDAMLRSLCSMNSKLSEALSESVRVSSWMVCPAQPDDKFVFFESGAFYAGDAMTMVHPVVGGGIPIAIAGSAMLGSLADEAEKNNWNEERLVREYSGAWKRRFGQRALLASLIGRAERSDLISKLLFSIFGVLPDAFPALMRRTRRDPVLAS